MQKGYKEIKTWFSLYSSKYLWIFFSLFACLWGKHLARTSPRNPFSSAGALPLAKCSGIVNGCWWPGLCFWHHQWPLRGVPGWQVGWKQSTLHSHLNQWLDAPSPKCPVLNHLGKPSHFQVLRNHPSPPYWWLARRSLISGLFISRTGELAWLCSHRAKPWWCWDPNKCPRIFID